MLPRIARRVLALRSPALRRPSREIASSLARGIHTSEHRRDDKKNEKTENEAQKSLVLHAFENADQKEKKAYLDILREYKSNNASRRGHVQFIRAAIKYMDDFGVNRDLEVYKALLDVLPKGKFVPTHYIQTLFVHYPEQQYVAVELLGKMEHNCVMPDLEVQEMLLNIFGQHGLPLKKFWRMMYWMPKFANLNPWPCRRPAPTDPRVLARLAMKKISSVDVRTKITEYETKDVEDSIEDTWIVSAMSSLQEELLQTQSPNSPIFVEGPYLVWVADQCIDYFMLRGNTKKEEDTYEDPDDVSDIRIPFWDKREVATVHIVHEQSDGTYFAMCATGTSTKDSLVSWIRCLQKRNPILNMIPIVFKVASSTKEQLYIESSQSNNEIARRED